MSTAQEPWVDMFGVPLYNRGSDATNSLINFVGASNRIDIGNGSVNSNDLFDLAREYEYSSAGVIYPQPLTFDGTRLRLLDGWQLRRWHAGDTLAEILADTSAEAGDAVDAVNGSVTITSVNSLTAGDFTTIAASVWNAGVPSTPAVSSYGERVAKKLATKSDVIAAS